MAKTPTSPSANPSKANGPIAAPSEDLSFGKGHATPTRKEKEAARKRPLVSSDRSAARKLSRVEVQAQRERARIGMANGEEKYLPLRDRGPQRRFVRDYVDARINVGEALIPFMFIVILVTLVPSTSAQEIGLVALWALFLVAAADVILLGFTVRKKLGAKFGVDRIERGMRFYAAMRALQMRILRLPKPQVKRGQFPS